MRPRNVKNKNEILNSNANVIINPSIYKDKWHEVFENDSPIYIEIGSGKCKFIIENAKKNKNINYIGIEKIDSILALGVKNLNEFIPNLRLINFDASNIADIFNSEISLIYLNFSDPWPKNKHEKRRLTSATFLKEYDKIFKSNKKIIFKTDNEGLYKYSILSLSNYGYVLEEISFDLHSEEFDNITTEYEDKFSKKGIKIFYLKAKK